ncbi:TRAP transporter small permease [Desulforhopalus singaporensis]|uniref:TRAP-type C4-dicarboxylate transport system, small permease component n=1 Tax=Desulforhopalus singaporensis TaxID=91360 RepID=A0A1H0RM78_9BACT|nr:TRAP transporter small permease [Desulforhopalus singaporensis]SDP30624.1 TRAP-type C4-dicarboxylate transport system, small permease component [Desulforhopalus singaporensis]
MADNNNEIKCSSSSECIELFSTRKNIFDRITINGFSIICFSTSVILTLIICAATFFRYIVKGDLYGYEEWVKIFAFWLYFAGASIGAYNRTHVSADLVNAYLKEGIVKNFLVFLRNLITVSVCLLFTWYGYEFFMFGFMGPLGTGIAIPKTTVWRISFWVGYLSVFSGLGFMSVYFIRDLVISIRALFGRKGK